MEPLLAVSERPLRSSEPRSEAEAKQAAEHNRHWCERHHKMQWQERKRHGFWSYYCPTCQEWRV